MPVAVAKNIHAIYYNSTALQPEWDAVENTVDNIRGVLSGYRVWYHSIITTNSATLQTMQRGKHTTWQNSAIENIWNTLLIF